MSMGIYRISFLGTSKVYIGSSVDLAKRNYEHKRTLRKQEHINRYLQRACNKYGLNNMKFDVLEILETEENMKIREQYWVDFYKAAKKEYGYNIVPNVIDGGTSGLKYSPERREKHQAHLDSMWNKRRKVYKFISPEGEVVEMFGLRQFCIKNGLHLRTMYNVHNNVGAVCQGWKKYHEDGFVAQRKGHNFEIKSPKEEIFKGNNLKEFCKDNHISYESIRKLGRTRGWELITWEKSKKEIVNPKRIAMLENELTRHKKRAVSYKPCEAPVAIV